MSLQTKTQNRRKFIAWGFATAALFSAVKFIKPSRKKKQSETVRMLTQDGKLVDVDIASVQTKGKKISDKELQNWIKK